MKFLYYLLQFTWGLPQNLLGYFLTRKYKESEEFFGSRIYYHNDNWGGISLGMFIIINAGKGKEWIDSVKVHEYGHSIQSIILGPLYLFVIGLPSLIWCNSKRFITLRKEKNVSYYSFYPERWANYLGTKITKIPVKL